MKLDGSAVRQGMVIEYKDKLWLVVKHEIRTPGNLRAFNQVELRDVKTGTKDNVRFSSSETIERVQIEGRTCNYLYSDGDLLHFMDNDNYDQFTLNSDAIGEKLPFLQENMTVQIEMYEGQPISVRLPDTVVLTIVEADAVVKGQTASSSYKPAVMENGIRVLVPPYIASGEKIVVKTEDSSYVERVRDK